MGEGRGRVAGADDVGVAVPGATLGLLAAALLLVLPILLGRFVPIVDLPNHLARVFVIRHLHEVPAFDATFRVIAEPIPNVAADVVLYGLLRVMEPLAAARAFLALTALLFAAGCWALAYAARGGCPSWTAVPAALLFYCSPLLYGFVNYVFGVALFCLSYAAWLVARRRWTAAGFVLVTALTMAAYLAHLTAYAFVGFAVGVTALFDAWERRRAGEGVSRVLGRLVLDGAPLVPPLVAFAMFMRGSGRAGSVAWNGVQGKVIALFGLVRTYDVRADLAFALLVVAAVAGVLWAGGRRPSLRDFDRRLLAVGIGLLVVFLAAPRDLITASGADARLILPAGVVLLVSYRGNPRTGRRVAYATALVAVLAARVCVVWNEWARFEPAERRALALLDRVPEGARIFPIFAPAGGADEQKRERVFRHFVHYATIRRHAYVPSLFAWRGQQPLVFRVPPPEELTNGTEAPTVSRTALATYDYVWACGGDSASAARGLAGLARPVGEAAPCALWQVTGARSP